MVQSVPYDIELSQSDNAMRTQKNLVFTIFDDLFFLNLEL